MVITDSSLVSNKSSTKSPTHKKGNHENSPNNDKNNTSLMTYSQAMCVTQYQIPADSQRNLNDDIIHALLLRKNAQQLMRSANNPFATGSIIDACGFNGEKSVAEKLLGISYLLQKEPDL
jgi:hypothetical protein